MAEARAGGRRPAAHPDRRRTPVRGDRPAASRPRARHRLQRHRRELRAAHQDRADALPANGYNQDPWQTTTTRIGTALGREAQAKTLVAEVEQAIAAAKQRNPGFAGKTFTIGPVQPNGTINTISSDTDASAVFMGQLGMTLSPAVKSLPPGMFPGRAVVSPELLNSIDADVLILTHTGQDARKTLAASELFQRIPAVARGSYIALDITTALAMAFPSAPSIPYALDQCVPKIAEALAKPR